MMLGPPKGWRRAAALAVAIALPVHAAADEAKSALRILSRKPSARPNTTLVAFQEELPRTPGGDAVEARSVGGTADFDCATGRVRVEQYTIYAEPRLQGRPIVQVARQATWRAVGGDSTLGRVKLIVCPGAPTPRDAPPKPAAPAQAGSSPRPSSIRSAPASVAIAAARAASPPIGAIPDPTPRDPNAPMATALEARLSEAAAPPPPVARTDSGKLLLRGRL